MTQLAQIISGGQTGVDRGALDFAIEAGIPHGGYVPKGRRAEDGQVPDKYQLVELDSSNYLVRTRANVLLAQGTLILSPDRMPTGGTYRTLQLCRDHDKPWWYADPFRVELAPKVAKFLRDRSVVQLNVAGPRESKVPGIQEQTQVFLKKFLEILNQDSEDGV